MQMLRFIDPQDSEVRPSLLESEKIFLSPPKLKRVLVFVESHLHEKIRLVDLARAAGLSSNHFLRVFKRATGDTPYQYLRARRLERACQLLARDSASLAQLALDCGFANQAHFTAAFSREFGVPPGRYRRAIREQPAGGISMASRQLALSNALHLL
jgi:AraC-like DNA-binding protein